VQPAMFNFLAGPVATGPPQGGRKHPHQEFTPVDTTNILFICGGAFVGLEKVIERRVGQKSLGFHTDAQPSTANRRNIEILEQAQPTDLIRYGLIPEFVGRLPVMGVLGDLDKPALMRILTEPKNALIRQYQRLFEFENVKLHFTDDAIETVAELALARKVGARGLRMILEDLMLELMYHLPTQRKARDFSVTAEMVRGREINWGLLEKAG
jgi:ATP-dependent Clp protease ATP-binding subunit ClpX